MLFKKGRLQADCNEEGWSLTTGLDGSKTTGCPLSFWKDVWLWMPRVTAEDSCLFTRVTSRVTFKEVTIRFKVNTGYFIPFLEQFQTANAVLYYCLCSSHSRRQTCFYLSLFRSLLSLFNIRVQIEVIMMRWLGWDGGKKDSLRRWWRMLVQL